MVKLTEISSSWGIPDVSIFASLTLQKRWSKGEPVRKKIAELTKDELYERQIAVKKRLQEFLGNTEIIPKFVHLLNDVEN
jgi:hypothetical protein